MAVALVCGVRLGVAAVDLDALYINLPGAVLRLHGLLGAEVGRWLLGGGRFRPWHRRGHLMGPL